jgi:hypothetical protein
MVTQQICSEFTSKSVKRVKTEKSEVEVSNKMFSNVYQKMKNMNPNLSIHSYFIACLHSTKETDMELVNINNSDTELTFALR